MMRSILLFIAVLWSTIFVAQIPKSSYHDFGYQKKVAKVEIMQYDWKDKIVMDNQKEVFEFDANGNLSQIQTTYFSDNYNSLKKYNYKNNRLSTIVESNSQRKDFFRETNYSYSSAGQLTTILSKSKGDKSTYLISYLPNKNINEIHGKFSNSYQYEKYVYNANGQLWKKELNYYEKDTVSSSSKELYLNNQLVAECSASKKYILFYTQTPTTKEERILKIKPERLDNEFLNLGDLVQEKYKTLEDFNSLIRGIKDVKIIKQEFFKLNQHKDWIVDYYVENVDEEYEVFYFKKITYADGTTSGSTQFDISLVNPLKAKRNAK